MSLPKPYYDDGEGIVIYCGDCRDILPHLPKVDLVLTDPPYGGLTGGYEFKPGGVAKVYRESISVGDIWQANFEWLDLVHHVQANQLILFTTYHAMRELLLRLPGKLIMIGAWHKPNAHPGNPSTPKYSVEYYVGSRLMDGCDWRGISDHLSICQDFGGCMDTGDRIRNSDGSNAHPTQKPLELMSKLIPRKAETILDPFCGVGTTLRAAKDLGRKCIGIEIEERYCEIAVRRLAQEVLKL